MAKHRTRYRTWPAVLLLVAGALGLTGVAANAATSDPGTCTPAISELTRICTPSDLPLNPVEPGI